MPQPVGSTADIERPPAAAGDKQRMDEMVFQSPNESEVTLGLDGVDSLWRALKTPENEFAEEEILLQAAIYQEVAYFLMRVDEEIARAQRHEGGVEIIVIRRVVPVSELAAFTARVNRLLAKIQRHSPRAARLNDQEVGVCLPTSETSARPVLAWRVSSALAHPASDLGASLYPADGRSSDELLRRARARPLAQADNVIDLDAYRRLRGM